MSSISTRDIEARTANSRMQRVPPPVAVCSQRALHVFDAVMGIKATGRVRRPVAEPSNASSGNISRRAKRPSPLLRGNLQDRERLRLMETGRSTQNG